ncbi:MAG: TraB/GumN family protein [Opitutales bacterium]
MLPRISRVLLGLCLSALILRAETSVWKVTSGPGTLYLGGTCHVLRAVDYPLPREFDQAFTASRVLYLETDVGRLADPAIQQELLSRGLLTDGTTLDQLLTPAAWQAVERYAARTGLPPAGFANLKPWMLVMMISSLEMQKLDVTEDGVDSHYYKLAGQASKPAVGLETVEQQIDYLANLGAGHESEMVLQSMEELHDLPKLIPDIIDAWKKGDAARLDQDMLGDLRRKYPSIYTRLIVERNRNWLPVIERLLTKPETSFVLVGAGHLVGPDGLLEALRKHGARVEQVRAN